MLEGINVNERISFTYSKDKEPKTEIILKPLSSFEMMKAAKDTMAGDFAEYILMSVVEIKNPDIKKPEDVDKFIATQSVEVLSELMEKINSINSITDDEQKN